LYQQNKVAELSSMYRQDPSILQYFTPEQQQHIFSKISEYSPHTIVWQSENPDRQIATLGGNPPCKRKRKTIKRKSKRRRNNKKRSRK
jgi:hypothetical protein